MCVVKNPPTACVSWILYLTSKLDDVLKECQSFMMLDEVHPSLIWLKAKSLQQMLTN
jgi:hypothetical protein